MDSPTNEDVIGSGDLIQDVYVYLTERRYPLSCTEARKRSIRRKAEKFVIREGELYFIKKKKKGRDGKKVSVAVVNDLRIGGSYRYTVSVVATISHFYDVFTSLQEIELRYIQQREEQLKILRACHADPTSGHMGEKKTINRITERFMWPGIVRDVKEMVGDEMSC